jgi:lipopolysaccharide biosynthesis glycosyltransferase
MDDGTIIHVVVTIDRNYVQVLGVMLHSLLSNTAS